MTAISREITTARINQAFDRALANMQFTFAVWDAIFAMQRARAFEKAAIVA